MYIGPPNVSVDAGNAFLSTNSGFSGATPSDCRVDPPTSTSHGLLPSFFWTSVRYGSAVTSAKVAILVIDTSTTAFRALALWSKNRHRKALVLGGGHVDAGYGLRGRRCTPLPVPIWPSASCSPPSPQGGIPTRPASIPVASQHRSKMAAWGETDPGRSSKRWLPWLPLVLVDQKGCQNGQKGSNLTPYPLVTVQNGYRPGLRGGAQGYTDVPVLTEKSSENGPKTVSKWTKSGQIWPKIVKK
eukprot:gene7494-biopygen1510